jgi:hypothetical protein
MEPLLGRQLLNQLGYLGGRCHRSPRGVTAHTVGIHSAHCPANPCLERSLFSRVRDRYQLVLLDDNGSQRLMRFVVHRSHTFLKPSLLVSCGSIPNNLRPHPARSRSPTCQSKWGPPTTLDVQERKPRLPTFLILTSATKCSGSLLLAGVIGIQTYCQNNSSGRAPFAHHFKPAQDCVP